MRVTLEATAGPGTGRKILLRTKQVARIGRTQLADYAFEDAYLSGVHFSVSFDGRECRLQDLGSSNGTFVNGQQVMEATLNSGDEIAAGGCRFAVKIDLTAAYRPPVGRPLVAEPSDSTAVERPAESVGAAAGSRAEAPPQPVRSFVHARTQPIPATKVEVPDRYGRGFADEDAEVRAAALFAAVWGRQPWLMRHLAQVAAEPSPDDLDALRMFAILAEPTHLNAIVSVVRNATLGPERFQVAAVFGHPTLVKDLLTAMSWEDAAVVQEAGAAFERITGAEIAAAEPADAAPDEGSPAAVTGLDVARTFWSQEETRFARGQRWSRGRDVSQGLPPEALQDLDLESRWEVLVRDHFYRRREVSLRELQLWGLFRDAFAAAVRPKHQRAETADRRDLGADAELSTT